MLDMNFHQRKMKAEALGPQQTGLYADDNPCGCTGD